MTIGVALYGLGTVGRGLIEILEARRAEILARHGLSFRLDHVVVRDPTRPRAADVDPTLITGDGRAPLEDPGVGIVVEAIGGLEPAGTIVRDALRTGRSVVTANKALIAARGPELERCSREHGGMLRYEAAVGGAIPVLHALRSALVANRIQRVRGILNGTTNYILTRMGEDGLTLEDALAKAQALGFAEADPTADLSGMDAAQKLVILARHAFGRWAAVEDAAVEGIGGVTPERIRDARMSAQAVKLVAEAVRGDDGAVSLRVAPTRVAADGPLGLVRDETNAVLIEGDFAGPLLFVGRGAGGRATGSAVFADLVDVALARRPVAAAAP